MNVALRERGTLDATRTLVASLRSPACYSHSTEDIKVLETHISCVFLVGAFAYKVKKPLALPFLDYSTLVARRHYCEEEVRLNARTAPELYLGVVPITGTPERPLVDGPGMAIEYAVRMRRFPEAARLEVLAREGELWPFHVDALAAEIARFHDRARRGPSDPDLGSSEAALSAALDNFRTIRALEGEITSSGDDLEAWMVARHGALRETMRNRQRGGFVRECHGDLHLGNVVLLEQGPVPFDCIEFNDGFRWIDVMSDVAFVVMDLHHHGRPDLAARFLDAYLERTGDYDGLAVLGFYLVYRAMVRAKIACIRVHQAGLGARERELERAAFRSYVDLAQNLAKPPGRGLVLMHGFSGSGKTTVAARLVEQLGAVRLRSDLVRKVAHGLAPLERTHSAVNAGMYARDATERTYVELESRALRVLRAGYPAIVDATFLEHARRRRFAGMAAVERVPFAIVDCVATEEVLRKRLAERDRRGDDASEAGPIVLAAQMSHEDPLDASERAVALACDTSIGPVVDEVARLLARRFTPA